jgi:hypothetical protein
MSKKEAKMKNGVGSALENLSTTEILMGILVDFGESHQGQKFPEQAVYKLFQSLEQKYHNLQGRYQVRKTHGRLQSEPLRSTLSFLEMGKILEVMLPNPVDQYYRPRQSQLDSLRKELKERQVLPNHEGTLHRLTESFVRYIQEVSGSR